MSKNLPVTAYLNEIPRNMPWPSATLTDWKHWLPNISCSHYENILSKSSLSSQNFPAESSVQTHFSQSAAFNYPRNDKQLKKSTSSADWEPALSEARAVVWEMEEKSILFPCASLSTGVGTAVIIIIFSTGHSELQQNPLHPLVLHHFIFTLLLWGLADLEEESNLQS